MIREVPRSFVYECDACGAEHVQENASGHYTNSRPSQWMTLKLERDATDYQGAAVASADVKLLLCLSCGPRISAAVNEAAKVIRSLK